MQHILFRDLIYINVQSESKFWRLGYHFHFLHLKRPLLLCSCLCIYSITALSRCKHLSNLFLIWSAHTQDVLSESESVKVKVWKWKCESESVKVKVWKWKCESESVKVWKWKCESVQTLQQLISDLICTYSRCIMGSCDPNLIYFIYMTITDLHILDVLWALVTSELSWSPNQMISQILIFGFLCRSYTAMQYMIDIYTVYILHKLCIYYIYCIYTAYTVYILYILYIYCIDCVYTIYTVYILHILCIYYIYCIYTAHTQYIL